MLNVQSFGDKHPGKRRKNNEDFIAWFEPTDQAEIIASGNLYILADGVGGAAEGERASQYAAQKVLHEYYQQPDMEPGERLRKLMTQASKDIFNYTEENGRFKRMATTMVAVAIRAGKMTVAGVGDSRVYLIRDGLSKQLTRDHSIVGEMVANGDMTEQEAMSSKIKNRLTRSLGGELDVHVDVRPPIPLKAGDKILLCSDGLTRYALREDIDKLTADGSPREIVERVIQYANRHGGADNVSAILIACGDDAVLGTNVPTQRPTEPLSIEETLDTITYKRPIWKPVFSTGRFVLPAIIGGTLILVLIVAASPRLGMLISYATPSQEPTLTPSLVPQDMSTPSSVATLPSELAPSQLPPLATPPQIIQTNTPLVLIVIIPSPKPGETRIPVFGRVNNPYGLNLRNGPGLEYDPPISTLPFNQNVTILGKTEDEEWLYVTDSESGNSGWVSKNYIDIEVSGLGNLPIIPMLTPTASDY